MILPKERSLSRQMPLVNRLSKPSTRCKARHGGNLPADTKEGWWRYRRKRDQPLRSIPLITVLAKRLKITSRYTDAMTLPVVGNGCAGRRPTTKRLANENVNTTQKLITLPLRAKRRYDRRGCARPAIITGYAVAADRISCTAAIMRATRPSVRLFCSNQRC